MQNKFTIAIPTYKRKKCLKELLDILLVPELRELIDIFVSDNKSEDGTEELCADTKQRCSNFYYDIQKENAGYDKNVINCIKHCQTEYIWFFSDDDRIIGQDVKRVVERVTALGADGALVNSQVIDVGTGRIMDENLNKTSKEEIVEISADSLGKYIWWSTLLSGIVVRRKLIQVEQLEDYCGMMFVQLGVFWRAVYRKKVVLLGNVFIRKYDGNKAEFGARDVVIWTKFWTEILWKLKDLYGEEKVKAAAASLYSKENVSGIIFQFIMLRMYKEVNFNEGRKMCAKIQLPLSTKLLIGFVCLCPPVLIRAGYNTTRKLRHKGKV